MDESQLREGLDQYLQRLIDKPNQELYVTPRVERQWFFGESTAWRDYLDWDVFGYDGDGPYYFHDDGTLHKYSPEKRWEAFRNTGEPRRCVVTGLPGFGKSLLLDMTAVELAGIGKRMLAEWNSSSNKIPLIPFPLVIPLPSIARRTSPEASSEELGRIIQDLLRSLTPDPDVAAWLVNKRLVRKRFSCLMGSTGSDDGERQPDPQTQAEASRLPAAAHPRLPHRDRRGQGQVQNGGRGLAAGQGLRRDPGPEVRLRHQRPRNS